MDTFTARSTWAELDAATGGLSKPGKMPGHAWSIPASRCNVGGKLREAGMARNLPTVCRDCYALKGRYSWSSTVNAQERRLEAYNADPGLWGEAMVASIIKVGDRAFRFFDSGDLQSSAMLGHIAAVASALPSVRFWLPTRERGHVAHYLRDNELPENLNIRLSAALIGQELAPANTGMLAGITVSTVRAKGARARGTEHRCPAPRQDGQCGSCRACWNPRVAVVSYGAH